TMMPLMTAALATLTDQKIARGSTLMNIVQQVGASIGAALMSVVLTNEMVDHGVNAAKMSGAEVPDGPIPEAVQERLHQMLVGAADSFGTTFTVATAIVAVTIIPALFLARSKVAPHTTYDEDPAARS
ncbi:MAG: MFS transporter, partial [Actinomycetia bacterium]|nr:MFS transporter [Actinomycetes bacterium]